MVVLYCLLRFLFVWQCESANRVCPRHKVKSLDAEKEEFSEGSLKNLNWMPGGKPCSFFNRLLSIGFMCKNLINFSQDFRINSGMSIMQVMHNKNIVFRLYLSMKLVYFGSNLCPIVSKHIYT